MNKEEKEEDVDINIKILPNILKNVLNNNCKQKADSLINCYYCKVHVSAHSKCCDTAKITLSKDPRDVEGDRQAKLKEYCN
jgi:hypothetical protein